MNHFDIEAAADAIMSARHSDAFNREACLKILRDNLSGSGKVISLGSLGETQATAEHETTISDQTLQPKPGRFEAWEEKEHSLGLRPACVVFRYTDDQGRSCTQFIATCESANRDRNKDAKLIATLLNEAAQPKPESWPRKAAEPSRGRQEIAREAATKIWTECGEHSDYLDTKQMKDIILAAIERSHAAQPQRSDQPQTKTYCADCGKPYPFALDVHVPRSQWLDIAPGPDDAGLLCETCILERASKLPGVTVAHMIFEVTQPPTPAKATEGKQEWTGETVKELWRSSGFDDDFLPSKRFRKIIADAHNVALAAEREKATRLGIELLSTKTALNNEHTNAEAWRLTCEGKEGAYVKMEQQLAAERQRRKPLVDALQNIVNCDLAGMRKDFGNDTDRQFRIWAQNRARHALDALPKAKP